MGGLNFIWVTSHEFNYFCYRSVIVLFDKQIAAIRIQLNYATETAKTTKKKKSGLPSSFTLTGFF